MIRKALIPTTLAVACLLPAGIARAAEPHVTGTGAVPDAACSSVINLHATGLNHPDQFLDLWTTCGGTPSEVHVEGGPDCIAQIGAVAYVAYVDEGIRLVVDDRGAGADHVGVAVGAFKRATPANKCRGAAIEVSAAVGDFAVGMP